MRINQCLVLFLLWGTGTGNSAGSPGSIPPSQALVHIVPPVLPANWLNLPRALACHGVQLFGLAGRGGAGAAAAARHSGPLPAGGQAGAVVAHPVRPADRVQLAGAAAELLQPRSGGEEQEQEVQRGACHRVKVVCNTAHGVVKFNYRNSTGNIRSNYTKDNKKKCLGVPSLSCHTCVLSHSNEF